MSKTKAMVIYLDDRMLLSKKEYSSWREIQSEYDEKYKTNLEPMTFDELIDFFESDFGEETSWPFSRKRMIDFFHSEELVMQSDNHAQ